MNKSPFRILKLKSGDDIIARLVGNKKDKIKLERPMYLKFMHYVDNSSGMRRETLGHDQSLRMLMFMARN